MSFSEEIGSRVRFWQETHQGEQPPESVMLEIVAEARKAVPPPPRVLSDEDLDKLAADLMAGLIWFDTSLDPMGPFSTVLGIAGPVLGRKLLDEQASLFYEYLEKASPLAINEKPMFLSFNYLNATDHEALSQKVDALKAAMASVS